MGEEGIDGESGLAAAPYDQWVLLRPAAGSPRPPARYKHAAEVVQDKLYVVGGSRNGRSLSDVQVFDLRTLVWSPLNPTRDSNQLNHENNTPDQPFPALAGHSLVKWKNSLVVVAGNLRSSSSLNKVSVWLIDIERNSWSAVDTYGEVPIARSGQSVSLLGSRLIMFGGEDNKRRLLNDLHILDLETMIWEEVKTEKGRPAPRYDHSAAVYADQYLLIFGGSSHSTCFNDLYLLDLQTWEWSQPDTQGAHITPRSGHAGTMIDGNWYIVGGGDNASGSPDTVVMNASKFVWSVVTSVSARDPLACEGLTLCSTTIGEKFLIAFGGYYGKYNNEIFVLKLKPRNLVQPRLLQSPAAAAAAASVTAAYAVITATEEKTRDIVATDDLDLKGGKPASSSQKFVAEIDAVNAEKSKLESKLAEVRNENSKLRDKLDMANLSYSELAKELKSVQNQLAAEGSRCQKLESQIAAARKRLESSGSLENELEVLRQQISQVEQTMTTSQRQKSGGVLKWVVGSAEYSDDE